MASFKLCEDSFVIVFSDDEFLIYHNIGKHKQNNGQNAYGRAQHEARTNVIVNLVAEVCIACVEGVA